MTKYIDLLRLYHLQRPSALAGGADAGRRDGGLGDVRDEVVARAERHGVPKIMIL